MADKIRGEIRGGTFTLQPAQVSISTLSDEISFETFTRLFFERYSKERGKASWQDDSYMIRQLVAFPVINDWRLGEKTIRSVTEDDLETFIKHLESRGRAASTRNHYVQLIKAMSRWAVRKGYRGTPLIGEDSDVVRRKKEAQRNRRLEPDEEEQLLRHAKPHLWALIIAALESCCREGELLTLQWSDVSLARAELTVRAENAKDREHRTIPISNRLRRVLEARRHDPDGRLFPPSGYVFGNQVGRPVASVRRAWQTAVLKAHGHEPVWIWTKKKGPNDKGTTKLTPESQAAYRSINLHFHDLRHEGGSRLLEAGWPAHHVQHMLGHASLQQTSTYLNMTLRGLHESMRTLEQARAACKPFASTPTRGRRRPRKQAPAPDGNSLIH